MLGGGVFAWETCCHTQSLFQKCCHSAGYTHTAGQRQKPGSWHVSLICSPGVLEHEAFTEAQPGWQMLVEWLSERITPAFREAGQQQRKHWGESWIGHIPSSAFSSSSHITAAGYPADAAALSSPWRFLRASGDSGVATGCRANAGERHGSEETAVVLGLVLLALLAGRGLEPSKAQTERAAERQNTSLYLSFSLVCG